MAADSWQMQGTEVAHILGSARLPKSLVATLEHRYDTFRVHSNAVQALQTATAEELRSVRGMGPGRVSSLLAAITQHGGAPATGTKTVASTRKGTGVSAQAARDLNKLCEEVERARAVYYGAAPDAGVSDAEYDALLQRLRDTLTGQGTRKSAAVQRARTLLASVGVAPDADASALALESVAVESGPPGKGRPKRKPATGPAPAIRTVPHTEARGGRLLSLASVHSADELRTWWQRNVTATLGPCAAIIVEPKVDGLTLRLTYEGGHLIEAATRGDGAVGEDVLHAVPHVSGIPESVNKASPMRHFSVRGEVYISPQDFAALNARRRAAGEAPFATARNAAAGSLRVLHSSIAGRGLRFAAFELIPTPPALVPEELTQHAATIEPLDQWGALCELNALGFATVKANSAATSNIDEAIEHGAALLHRRADLTYETDGCVVKVRSIADQHKLGSVGTDPKFAVAWKPPPQTAVTVLRGIQCNIARTGVAHLRAAPDRYELYNVCTAEDVNRDMLAAAYAQSAGVIVPVATLEPVQIGGVTVQHASLHNTHFVAALDLRIGDTVFVERRGDVIPQVTRVLLAERPRRTAAWQPPDVCAACGTKLALRNRATPNSGDAPSAVKKEASAGVEMLMCPNEGCSARQGRLLRHFARVCAKGLGDKTVEMLAERGLVSAPTDLYTLKDRAAELRALPGFGERKVANLLRAIELSRNGSAALLLWALGVPHVGSEMAPVLIKHFGSLAALEAADETALATIDGIAEKTAAAIQQWFRVPSNARLAQSLAEVWNVAQPAAAAGAPVAKAASGSDVGSSSAGWSLDLGVIRLQSGQKIVFTGKLGDTDRTTLKDWARAHGLQLSGSVTKTTDCLVAADGPQGATGVPTGKYRAAQANGTPIVEDRSTLAELNEAISEWAASTGV